MTEASEDGLDRFLQRLMLRSRLTEEEQAAVLGLRTHLIHVTARRDLVSPGQTTDYACLVADGLIGRFDQMRDGRRQITAFHISGDMCDLHSVVSPTTGWGITALSNASVLKVAHVDLRRIVAQYPNIAMAFWRDTVADASILAKWVANLGRKDARARLAHLVCEMATRISSAGLGTHERFELHLNQEQIGDATGLTAVHVNRMIQSLRTENILSMHKHLVEVHDWNRLTFVAEFIPTFLLLDEKAQAVEQHAAKFTSRF